MFNTAKLMENIGTTNIFVEKPTKLTLRGYYDSLPRKLSPKQDFIQNLARECQVTETTVRNWLFTEHRPRNKEIIETIVRVTGISAEDLWA